MWCFQSEVLEIITSPIHSDPAFFSTSIDAHLDVISFKFQLIHGDQNILENIRLCAYFKHIEQTELLIGKCCDVNMRTKIIHQDFLPD